jgi:hypothetical protein
MASYQSSVPTKESTAPCTTSTGTRCTSSPVAGSRATPPVASHTAASMTAPYT